MLKLKDITKVYEMGETKVEALKGVSLCFRRNEFVSILGQSGCGKTTMLNIIGGLDRYTSGDLVINGKSTKEYKDKEWDTYRNHSIGFVFQSYNLIPHQTVLENVELALTLSGVSKQERKKKAIKVLERVGLGDKLKNKPSQLSGGQMQRVALARALVNDPEIILADEPTGALDTETSVQIMDLLKEISKDKLIIMVTHNPELAENYSNRIVRLLDGNLVDDSNPYTEEEESQEVAEYLDKKQKSIKRSKLTDKERKKREKKKRMSFWTALSLSFKNLLTKKARTILVAFAGSIGIIGIALILAVSSGFSTYINKMQEDTLSSSPITISAKGIDFTSVLTSMFASGSGELDHEKDAVYDRDSISNIMGSIGDSVKSNNLGEFNKYIKDNYSQIEDHVSAIQYTYDMELGFYKNQSVAASGDPSETFIQPGSNALMNMIVKYAMIFFEDRTHYKVEEKEGGNYLITKPEGVAIDETLFTQYPDDLADLKADLEADGTATLSKAKVIQLSFTLIGFGDVLKDTGGSGGSVNMIGDLDIFHEMIDNDELIKDQYDIVDGKLATEKDEAVLVLDKNHELDEYVLYALGLLSEDQMESLLESKVKKTNYNAKIEYSSIVNKAEYKVLEERDYWVQDTIDNTKWFDFRDLKPTDIQLQTAGAILAAYQQDPSSVPAEKVAEASAIMSQYDTYKNYYIEKINDCGTTIKIVGVVRLKDEVNVGSLTNGVAYRSKLTKSMIEYHNGSLAIGKTSSNNEEKSYKKIDELTPETISIFIKEFESKAHVEKFIEDYNANAEQGNEITYTDYAGMIMTTVSGIIDAITYILIAFVSVSLIVSSIMIGIITYISVIERTKEIGVLRSVGASKRDVKRVFTAESFIIGLASGVLGISISLILIIPINIILKHFTGIPGLAHLPWVGAIVLIVISVILTFISGLLPARAAAKKDPVIALREN